MIALTLILLSAIFPAIHNRCPDIDIRDERPILDAYYQSPSGHFWIHYDLTGTNAPSLTDNNANGIPDYVESAAEAADSARDILIGVMGYIEEENDEDGKYDIYIVQLSSSLWGLCQSESGGGSFIKIRKNYQGMSNRCDNEDDLLWLTVGHEFFHAIQDAYRSNSNDSYFRELTSMWFENIFVPECYDFLDFVDISSSSLFNNPEKEFDNNTSGQVGYSLALYAHYLSVMIDPNGFEDQFNSTIMRKIWEEYQEGGTIFRSLEDVLEDEYNSSFPETWIDFMSRNMFCGEYENMDNDIYYHIGQSFIEPLSVTYNQIDDDNTIEENNINIKDNKVSIYAYQPNETMMINTEISSNNVILLHGNLSDENIRIELTGSMDYELPSVDQSNKIFFMFTSPNGTENLDFTLNITIAGCTDPYAINYNPNAFYDDDSCEFPVVDKLISIYPNPINFTSSILTIIYDQVNNREIDVEIFDIKGRLISEKTFPGSSGREHISYGNVLDISSGIYFLKVTSNDNTEIVKFINMR